MDPFSAEGELLNIHTAFHQSQYQKVIDYPTASLSQSNQLPARVLKLRAKIALGQYDDVISELDGEDDTIDLAAIKAFAQFLRDPWDAEEVNTTMDRLVKEESDNLTVQLLCGTVLANRGMIDEAVRLLGKHQGSLDAVALLVQIHLQQNRPDLAIKETQQARSWAQDSLLVNLAEAWVGMRQACIPDRLIFILTTVLLFSRYNGSVSNNAQGGDAYQRAFYVFEELAQSPSTSSQKSLLSQALAELHLHRLDEASAALDQALNMNPEDPDVLANLVVLNTVLGKEGEAQDARAKLEAVEKEHALLKGLREKKEAFDAAMAKYKPKFDP